MNHLRGHAHLNVPMAESQLPPCGIDDEEIELYALGRVREPDPERMAHFMTCGVCAARMEEAKLLAAEIKRALGELMESEKARRDKGKKPRT